MKDADQSRYGQRGVSSEKGEVHAAIQNLDQGLFPGAFCKILPDVLTGSPDHCIIQHPDGAGTKAGLAWLAYHLTKDPMQLAGTPQDSLVMNFDDMGCVGALGPFLVSSTVNRNKALVPGEALEVLIREIQRVCDELSDLGIPCYTTSGETADVGDLVRTLTVDNTITTRMLRSQIVDASRIKAPAVIVGFSSTGQAKWEKELNSGIGSNGLTNARHDVLQPMYRQFTETFAPQTNPELVYCGKYELFEPLPTDPEHFTVASALLSPTRTYLPLIKLLFENVGRKDILALIHCSGGGQTKIGKFGQSEVLYVKDSMLPIPPLFKFLREARNLPWNEMYRSYNMGHRLEAVVVDEKVAIDCIEVSRECGIWADVVGKVVLNTDPKYAEKRVLIKVDGKEYVY